MSLIMHKDKLLFVIRIFLHVFAELKLNAYRWNLHLFIRVSPFLILALTLHVMHSKWEKQRRIRIWTCGFKNQKENFHQESVQNAANKNK